MMGGIKIRDTCVSYLISQILVYLVHICPSRDLSSINLLKNVYLEDKYVDANSDNFPSQSTIIYSHFLPNPVNDEVCLLVWMV